MKFTAFVLATAAVSAQAQVAGVAYQPAVQYPVQQYPVQYPVQQYPVQYPVQQYPVQYPVQQPQVVDPLAWERDCTWINSISFRAKLSQATCGADVCEGASTATKSEPQKNGGGYHRETDITKKNGFHVWGSVINRAGRVCAVAYTGADLTQQFPYGRIQSLKRANTASSLSLPQRAMPSHVVNRHSALVGNFVITSDTRKANRFIGGTGDNGWYGFSHDRYNPGNIGVQYQGATSNYGEACGTTRQDPICMQKPGGLDYSAGGLALYDSRGILRGAIGVAGDNDCTSHAIAWKARSQLNLDFTPANTDRATFNANTACTGFTATTAKGPDFSTTGTLAAQSTNRDAWNACNAVSPDANDYDAADVTNFPTDKAAGKGPSKIQWVHAGAKAEDNAVFFPNESRNFPACWGVIRRFSTTVPTQTAQGKTAK